MEYDIEPFARHDISRFLAIAEAQSEQENITRAKHAERAAYETTRRFLNSPLARQFPFFDEPVTPEEAWSVIKKLSDFNFVTFSDRQTKQPVAAFLGNVVEGGILRLPVEDSESDDGYEDCGMSYGFVWYMAIDPDLFAKDKDQFGELLEDFLEDLRDYPCDVYGGAFIEASKQGALRNILEQMGNGRVSFGEYVLPDANGSINKNFDLFVVDSAEDDHVQNAAMIADFYRARLNALGYDPAKKRDPDIDKAFRRLKFLEDDCPDAPIIVYTDLDEQINRVALRETSLVEILPRQRDLFETFAL
jgi:hypothetical protein